MVIDLNHLSNEIAQIRTQDVSVSPKNLKLSTRATISMPWHKIQDELEEERLSKSGAPSALPNAVLPMHTAINTVKKQSVSVIYST